MVCGSSRGEIWLLDLSSNQYRLLKHTGAPDGVACHGRDVFVCSKNKVYLLRSDGQLEATLTGDSKHEIHSVSCSSDGNCVLVASVDAATLYSSRDFRRLRTLSSASGIIQAAFVPRQDSIVAAFRDNTVLMWDATSYAVM